MPKPSRLRQLVVGVFLLLDSYLGVMHGGGIVTWAGVFSTQLNRLALSVEMMAGGLILIRILLNQSNP